MTLSNQQAKLGLTADAWPVSTGVSGPVTVGRAATTLQLTLATCAYVVLFGTITSAKTGTLTVKTGATTVTGGATVTDGDGLDFEGVAIPTLGTIYGLRVRRTDANAGEVTLTAASSTTVLRLNAGADLVLAATAGLGSTIKDAVFTIANSTTAAATVEISVLGKV